MSFDPLKIARRFRVKGLEPWLGEEHDVHVRELSALETLKLVERWQDADGANPQNVTRLANEVFQFTVDGNGNPFFKDESEVVQAPIAFLNAIFEAVAEGNRLSESSREDVRKNSPPAVSAGLSNGSALKAVALT